MIEKILKNKYYITLFFILILAAFLRFYMLGSIPSGLTNDEAGVGWDAYSILQTGRDQWNQFLPLHFIAFGDYPAPLLRYLTVPSILVFGLNSFAIRFPSALFGVISVLLIFFLGKKLFNEKIGLLASFLLAISPWAIGLSRVTIEPNIAITIFLFAFFIYLNSLKKINYLYISALLFALVLYTYSAYVLFLPLVAGLLMLWNKKTVFKNYKQYLISFILFVLILAPNFLTKNTTAGVRFSQVGIISNTNSIGLINTLNDERGVCQKSYSPIICKIADNKIFLFTSTFSKNYIAHFNINLLYNNGTDTQYSILPQRGLDYVFGVLLLLLGLIRIFKYKDKNGFLIILLLLIAPIPDSLTGAGHYGRASIMIPFFLMIEGIGLFYLIELISRLNNGYIKRLSYIFISLIVFFSVFIFWINYTTYFKNYYSLYSQYGYEDLMKTVFSQKNKYDKIYISRHLNDTKQYIYYLVYSKYDPVKFQNKKNIAYSYGSDGWASIDRIDNVYFVQNLPTVSSSSAQMNYTALFISNPVDFPKSVKPVFTVKDKLGNVLFEAIRASDLLEYEKSQEQLNLNKV